jgi:hypothetical protein
MPRICRSESGLSRVAAWKRHGMCELPSENGRVVSGERHGRHGICELAFNAAGERHGMCESALTVSRTFAPRALCKADNEADLCERRPNINTFAIYNHVRMLQDTVACRESVC